MEFICWNCNRCFSRKNNLVRHIKHRRCSSLSSSIRSFICEKCGVTFSRKSAYTRHIVGERCPVLKICVDTSAKDNSASKKKDLHARTLKFESNAEFLLWKDSEEQRTFSKYSQSFGSWLTKTGKRIKYKCHRGGKTRIKEPLSRKRNLKKKGSCKINDYCSAYILYEENQYDGKVTVQYNPIHCNHTVEIKHLPISSVDKENIADKLRVGVPLDQVLDDIRDTLRDDCYTRTQLITKHDLHNIMNEKKILYQERESLVDTMSIELIIEDYRTKFRNDTPFKYYKELGEKKDQFDKDDFFLVIMNSVQISLMKQYGYLKVCVGTHGTSNYDFYLHTVLVVNDLNMVVPVANAITNRENSDFLRKFFEIIKQECGVIPTTVFMSDDFPGYSNAWTEVMGKPKNILLCHWQVDKNWRKNLKLVNGSKELKDEVYKLVRNLMEESDEAPFPEIVTSAVQKLIDYPNTTEFGKYFEREYSNRYEMWSFAFRKYIGMEMDTVTKIERMYRELKTVYSHGLKNKRLDKLIITLLRMNRNKAFDRVSHLIMETDSLTLKNMRDRHESGTKILAEDVSIINDDVGIVKSQSNQSSIYEIKKIAKECYCRLRCDDCPGICVHLYECTCDDYVFGYNICEHIHAYALKKQFFDQSMNSIDNGNENVIEEQNICLILQMEPPNEINTSSQTRECIVAMAKQIIKNVECCEGIPMDEDDLKALSMLEEVNKMLQIKANSIRKEALSKSPSNYINFYSQTQ